MARKLATTSPRVLNEVAIIFCMILRAPPHRALRREENFVSTRMRCVVPLVDRRSPRRIVAMSSAERLATSQAFDWPGVLLEAGRNEIMEVDDLTLAHHYIGMNTDTGPVTLEVKGPHGFHPVTLAPGDGWLAPAGHTFSLRVRGGSAHSYVRVSIDPIRFDRLLASDDGAGPVRLRPTYGIGGPQLHHLIAALKAEADAGTPSGLAYVDALTTGLGLQMARQAGRVPFPSPSPAPARGGLPPAVRRRVLERMEAQPDARLTVDMMARDAGLSPAHFARAFKESTGRAPHQHLLDLRLERARRLLDEPDAALSDVALRSGFADQAHFTRFFKRRFGITPGALVRSRRRA
jgi:AraC family transcriptional regulator